MKRNVLLFASLSLLAAGCGGGGGSSGPSIYGSWAVASVTGGDPNDYEPVFGQNSRFLHVELDETFAVLDSTQDHGFHTLRAGVATVMPGQVTLDAHAYNFSIQGDTLLLTRPDATITLQRDASAPETDEWVIPAKVLEAPVTMPASVQDGTDLAFDGSGLWVGNAYYGTSLQQISFSTGLVTNRLKSPEYAWGMAWDGAHLWVSDDGYDRVFELSSTGTVLEQSPAMGAWLDGVAFDGTRIWAYSNNEQTLYGYVPGSGVLSDTIPLKDAQVYNGGLEFKGGFLYLTSGQLIYKIAPSPFQVVATYHFPDLDMTGIASDGTDFFVMGNANLGDYGSPEYRIVKISLP